MDAKLILAVLQLFALFGCLECITVSIRTNPASPPYPAATWIQLACDVQNANGAVQYNWTVHCSRDNPSMSRGGLYGRTDHGRFSVSLRSTPLSCADTIMCSAADSSGVATATWRNERVIGAGFWGNSQPLLNNTAMKADAMGRINAIHCHSSSSNTDVGRWISPGGVDITENRMDNFTVRFNNGPYYPSYSSLELLNPSTTVFSPANQGVYSCMTPDNTGLMQVLNIGIYPHGYQGVFNITAVRRVLPENVIALYCSTTGVPPTLSIWLRSGNVVTANETYQISQDITNRRTTDYYSVLTINQTLEEGQGLYECRMINGLYEPMDNNFTEVAVERHYIHVLPAGSVERLTCTIDTADTIQWEDANNDVVVAGPVIVLTINDTIHEKVYYCRGYRMQGIIAELQVVAITLVPESSLSVTASSDDGTPTLGQQYAIDCLVVLNVTGVQNRPVAAWVDSASGLALSPGNGVTISGPTDVASMGSQSVLRIAFLRTSHAGNYSCRGSVTSRALFSPLVKISAFSLAVTIPSPMVSLTPLQSGPYYASGSVTLQCQASSSSLVDTAVSLSVTWRKMNGVTLTNSNRIMITTDSQAYRSTLTITGLSSSLDTDSAYVCEVTIQPSSPTSFITPSIPVVSSPYTLRVVAVPITISVTPLIATVLDIQPYNRFSLTCIASTDFTTVQPKVFSWTKRVSGSSSSTTLTHNGGSVVIATTGQASLVSNSTLSILETQAGSYVYTCSVTIGGSSPATSVSTVTVRGRSLPTPAINLTSIVTDYSSATIEWTVPYFAYTQESYTVLYGTNSASLTQSSSAVSGSTDLSATNQHYSVQLTQLRSGTTYYYQIQSTNTVGPTVTSTSSFMITRPPIITAITDTTSGASPRAGGFFTLICSATEQETITGTPTVRWMDPSGRSLSEGTTGDFTVTRSTSGSTVTVSLRFSPVRGSHNGQYSCRIELGSISFVATETYNLTVQVSSSIPVLISANNNNFKAATPLQLSCQVDNRLGGILPVVGSTSYLWTSTCTGDCFVLGQTASSISNQALRAIDSGVHTCTITDSVGNYGTATFSFTVTGVGLYYSRLGLLANNSVIRASGGVLGSISCISGRNTPGIGQWISPSGQDYTQLGSGVQPFQVLVGGATNPGFLNVTLPGQFPAGQWEGVYSCVIPDENQMPQTLFVGIHIATTPSPVIQSLRPSSSSLYTQFTVNCTSTGSAATNVTWRKNGVQLSRSFLYDFSQILSEGVSSTYDNHLIVYQSNVNELAGNYSCAIENAFGTTSQTVSLNGIRVSEFGVFSLSDQISITCSSDLGATSVQWLYNSEVVASSGDGGSQVELRIDQVSDSLLYRQYICQAMSPFGIQQHIINILIEIDADRDLSIAVVPSDPIPMVGEPFTLTCTVTKAAGLQNPPSIQWSDTNGSPVFTLPAAGIYVNDTVVSGNEATRSIYFDSLQPDYQGAFRCTGLVTSPAPPGFVSKTFYWEVIAGEEFRPTTSAPPTEPPSIIPKPCSQTFQLLLGPIDDCTEWRFEDTEEKTLDIIDALVQQVNQDCTKCSLTAQEITDTRFTCLEDNPKSVLFQATITGDNTFNCDSSLSTLKDWTANESPSVAVSSNILQVDSSCSLQVNNPGDPPKCGDTSTSHFGLVTIIAIVVFATLATIVIIFAVTIGIICGIKMHRRGKTVIGTRRRRGSDVDPLTPPSPDITDGANIFTGGEVDEKNRSFNKHLEAYTNPLEEYEQESERSVKIVENPTYVSASFFTQSD